MSVAKIAAQKNDPLPLTRVVADFIALTLPSKLQGEARDILKLSLLDWSAVALAGVNEPVSQIVRNQLIEEEGKAEATIFGSSQKLPARAAALVNGTISHALDYDDTHFDYIGHPSVVIFSAALAVAQKTGASGSAFLDAALIGMETACRIGRWLGMAHYQHGFHQTATAGSFGATASAARLLGLNSMQTRHALGIAATRASGLKSQFGTMGKPYNAGIAASNGVEAAMLAAQGFISQPDGLECEQGFGDTHAGEARELSVILDGLGETFRFSEVQHKFHACCHGTHSTLEALLRAMAKQPTAAENIDHVTLTVAPKWLRVCNLTKPTTGLEAKFSYTLTTAMALLGHNTGALSTFSDAACANTALINLRDRVQVETDVALKDTAAKVKISRKSGVPILAEYDLDQPIPLTEKTEKLIVKARGLIGDQKADTIFKSIAQLDGESMTFFEKTITQ
jgi:2-methylcitrate dehydratase PrpD